MRFQAINVFNNKKINGIGFCPTIEDPTISILFIDKIEWIDGTELKAEEFTLVYTNTIKLVNH